VSSRKNAAERAQRREQRAADLRQRVGEARAILQEVRANLPNSDLPAAKTLTRKTSRLIDGLTQLEKTLIARPLGRPLGRSKLRLSEAQRIVACFADRRALEAMRVHELMGLLVKSE
jgi:alkylation response protein AidB-like acyl-CoA dehydrogenase